MSAPDPKLGIPIGLRIAIGEDVESYDDGRTLLNRSSGRLLRLKDTAGAQISALTAAPPSGLGLDGSGPSGPGPGVSAAGRRLGRQLLAAGLAHPIAERVESLTDLTVIIPARDRVESLRRCLAALGSAAPVIVVDDGSLDPSAVEQACREHGATYVARAVNGGPAAARNTGLSHADTALIAFLDSDCVADAEWLHRLAGHFADPLVAAVAPRIVALRPSGHGAPLDLGPQSSLVSPGGRVSYVPTAALIGRRAALATLGAPVFDEALRYGEDVDLIWRLHDAGWWVRYDACVTIAHDEPVGRGARLARRFRYGTSAGPLARRHPQRLAPVRLSWPSAGALALVLLRRPGLAVAVYLASTARLQRTLRPHHLPPTTAPRLMGRAFAYSAIGTAQALNTHLPGGLIALAIWRRRPILAALSVAPLALEWAQQRPTDNPIRWALRRSMDDAAYGAGVWVGALRARTARPLLARFNSLFSPGRCG